MSNNIFLLFLKNITLKSKAFIMCVNNVLQKKAKHLIKNIKSKQIFTLIFYIK